jgi:DNA-binding response OmpR family regulator
VLVVEDEQALGRLICEALATEGHTSEHVRDAEGALDRLARAGVDLVISDLRMPGMNGDGLHEQIERRHPHLARRLLLTTGDTLSEEAAGLARRTGLGVLHKPFDVEDLCRRVRALLSGEPP